MNTYPIRFIQNNITVQGMKYFADTICCYCLPVVNMSSNIITYIVCTVITKTNLSTTQITSLSHLLIFMNGSLVANPKSSHIGVGIPAIAKKLNFLTVPQQTLGLFFSFIGFILNVY